MQILPTELIVQQCSLAVLQRMSEPSKVWTEALPTCHWGWEIVPSECQEAWTWQDAPLLILLIALVNCALAQIMSQARLISWAHATNLG